MKKLFAHKGFTIFFATLVGSLSLAIGIAIYDLTIRELDLSATANESQYAIYAADSGAECALYWDFQCPNSVPFCNASGGSAFSTSSASSQPTGASLLCNGQDISSIWTVDEPLGQGRATTTFTITFSPAPYCATVEVGKSGSPTQTTILSHGFNTCDTASALRLERALQINY